VKGSIQAYHRYAAMPKTELPATCARCQGYLHLVVPPSGVPFWKCDRCDHESDACYVLAEIEPLSPLKCRSIPPAYRASNDARPPAETTRVMISSGHTVRGIPHFIRPAPSIGISPFLKCKSPPPFARATTNGVSSKSTET